MGTSTEIYEYLRLLFARIGHTFSPISGEEVKRHTVEDVIDKVKTFTTGTRFVVLAPIKRTEGRTLQQQLTMLLQQGYTRILCKGDFQRIENLLENEEDCTFCEDEKLWTVVDRKRPRKLSHVSQTRWKRHSTRVTARAAYPYCLQISCMISPHASRRTG